MNSRAIRFWLLQHVLLPVVGIPVRLLLWSWRIDGHDEPAFRAMETCPEPAVVAMLHGSTLCLMGVNFQSGRRCRRKVVLVSPSRDGELLTEALRLAHMTTVRGSSKKRGVAGMLELIDAVKAGGVGVVAVDGPRGPRCVAKPGAAAVAEAAGARFFCMGATAKWAIRFGSWDRQLLPLPFARVTLRTIELDPRPDPQQPGLVLGGLASVHRAAGDEDNARSCEENAR